MWRVVAVSAVHNAMGDSFNVIFFIELVKPGCYLFNGGGIIARALGKRLRAAVTGDRKARRGRTNSLQGTG